MTMRDAFWEVIYKEAKKNSNIIIVSADFAAPALDKFRAELPSQFINVGIAEQNAILTAAGLAMSGKKVYVTAIATFLSMRCYEQIRLHCASMNLDITFVAGGVGVGFDDSGPTHHAVEDIALMRMLPNMKVFTPPDNILAEEIARQSLISKHPMYVRCDRVALKDIYNSTNCSIKNGFNVLYTISKVTVVAYGNMIHEALCIADICRAVNIEVGVIDLFRCPIETVSFIDAINHKVEHLISIEEHSLPCGVGSNICEIICDNQISITLKRFAFDFSAGYSYDYGGRSIIHKKYNMDKESIINYIKKIYSR